MTIDTTPAHLADLADLAGDSDLAAWLDDDDAGAEAWADATDLSSVDLEALVA